MLLAAVSVLVVVASGDPSDGSTRAIEVALRAALARDATIVVRTAERDTSDDSAMVMGRTEHATLLGIVAWSERQRRVIIRFAKLPDGRFTDREVRFDAADAPSERGRTVGFALASMMPDEAFAVPHDVQPAADSAPPPANSALPAIVIGASSPIPAEHPSAQALPRPNPLGIDATALAVSSPTGYGGGVGGQFALRLPLVGALGLRVAVGARGESIGPAQATSRLIGGAVGLAWQPWLDPSHRWAVGVRVDGLAMILDVAHFSDDDAEPDHRTRFLGGFDGAVEGTFRFADHAALVGALGTEVSFGRTELYVHDRPAASLPPGKVLAELGLRVSFP